MKDLWKMKSVQVLNFVVDTPKSCVSQVLNFTVAMTKTIFTPKCDKFNQIHLLEIFEKSYTFKKYLKTFKRFG